jgi:hypothetical protein
VIFIMTLEDGEKRMNREGREERPFWLARRAKKKSLNHEDHEGHEERHVFVGPAGQKDIPWRSFFAVFACLSERSERAVKLVIEEFLVRYQLGHRRVPPETTAARGLFPKTGPHRALPVVCGSSAKGVVDAGVNHPDCGEKGPGSRQSFTVKIHPPHPDALPPLGGRGDDFHERG